MKFHETTNTGGASEVVEGLIMRVITDDNGDSLHGTLQISFGVCRDDKKYDIGVAEALCRGELVDRCVKMHDSEGDFDTVAFAKKVESEFGAEAKWRLLKSTSSEKEEVAWTPSDQDPLWWQISGGSMPKWKLAARRNEKVLKGPRRFTFMAEHCDDTYGIEKSFIACKPTLYDVVNRDDPIKRVGPRRKAALIAKHLKKYDEHTEVYVSASGIEG